MLIHRQISYVPNSKRRTGYEAQSRETVNKVKKKTLYKSSSVHPWKL
jgi:hypothetical protein